MVRTKLGPRAAFIALYFSGEILVRATAFSLLVALLFFFRFPLTAQYTTANLGGTVADASGAAVPEAKVTVRNTETGFMQSTTSSDSGGFLFPRLPSGPYELRVEKAGFASYVQSGLTLAVD
jgi:hypothetical protein